MTERTKGLLFAGGAFVLWGLFPLFWDLLRSISAVELTAHRVFWSLVFLGAFLRLRGRGAEFSAVLRNRRLLGWLSISALLLGINFLTFVYAVETGRILEASLGYFLNPMLNIVLGRVALGERLRGLQWGAVAFAAAGVLQMGALAEQFPWIALVLAGAFATYGLIRKTAEVAALPGTTVEALLLSVLGLAWVVFLEVRGVGHFLSGDLRTRSLLVVTGLVTAVPLVFFSSGARRITLGTLAFMQFVAPTLQFLIAVLVFGENFGPVHVSSFGCIWVGVVLFILHALRRAQALRRA